MTDKQYIRYSIEQRVATVVIDHPPANAFDTQTVTELNAALDELLANDEVKVIILTGGGQMAFVAGADINEIKAILGSDDPPGKLAAASKGGQDLFVKIERSPKPVIAAINGFCLGGGLELAMACHIRIAGDRVRLGQPEINLGIIPGWGGTQRLARLLSKGKAIEMILTGDQITAQEAKALGLINLVVPGDAVIRQATGLARKIAAKGGLALAAALRAINTGLEGPLADGLAIEREQFGALAASADAHEGIDAFLAKRPAEFKDK
ncbi:MAG: enoyl-CoA hydratase/isomerase family protein [Thermoflexales bacterium]|nr:enoyl-CoA hydratase/isomerase family protein [Thermoflexales bacterium]